MISVKGLPFTSPSDYFVYYLEPDGTQVIVYADGRMAHPKLASGQRKELELRIRIDKLFAKITMAFPQENHQLLRTVPEQVGLKQLDVWGTIISNKMTPQEAVTYLHDLYRLHGLLWRG